MEKISFKKPGKLKKILIIIAVFAAIIFLLNLFQHDVRNLFYSFSMPSQKILWQQGNGVFGFFNSIVKSGNLQKEINALKNENQNFVSRLVLLEDLKKENETLRTALEIGLEKEFKIIPTQIISKDNSTDIIVIDRGARDGVSKNMPLINAQKALFGKVVEVYDNFSKVMLISGKNSSFDGAILGKDVPGLVKGAGDLKAIFDLIPNDKKLSENDIIISSGLGGIFPKNLLVGKVKKVNKSDLEPIQKADIEPFFNITGNDILFLITGR